MAKKNLENVSLILSYADGTTSDGKVKTSKKTYTNIKNTASVDQIYAVATSIKSAMDTSLVTISVTETNSIISE